MRTGSKGLALIKEFEGYHTKLPDGRCKAYLDKLVRPELRSPGYPGLWTIGYGSTGSHVTEGTVWTQEQAEADLRRLVASHEEVVKKLVTVPLDQNQFDALVSLSYNMGLHKAKTLLRKLNAGDEAGASAAFMLYDKAGGKSIKGLTRRRAAERKLFDTYTPEQVVEESAKLTWLQRLRLWITGLGIGSWFTMENFKEVQDVVRDNAGLFLLGAGVLAWVVFKLIEKRTIKDYEDGRYIPSGIAAKE